MDMLLINHLFMNNNSKIILGILIVVIIGVGAYFLGKNSNSAAASVYGIANPNVASTISPTNQGGGMIYWYWCSAGGGTFWIGDPSDHGNHWSPSSGVYCTADSKQLVAPNILKMFSTHPPMTVSATQITSKK